MLENVLRYMNNRFECGTVHGDFTVEHGGIEVAGLSNGQYFWVEGSVFNDGLHRYPAGDMADETFSGRVVMLAVPKAVVSLADEIQAWNEANAGIIDGPFSSESFGGYSYTRETMSANGDGTPAAAWQVHFGTRMREWRKLAREWA